jgi:hypothetical protein
MVSPMTAHSERAWLRPVTVNDWHEGEVFGEPKQEKKA